MKADFSSMQLLLRIWPHIGDWRRRQLALLLILMVAASFAEVMSLGAVLPFLGVLTAPERLFANQMAQPLVQMMSYTKPEQLLLPLTFLFCAAVLVANGLRLLLLWANTRLSFAIGADLGIEIYRRTLYQPYVVHMARNSSEIIAAISSKTNTVIHCGLMPVLTIGSSVFILISIAGALLLIDPLVSVAAFVGFGAIYLLILKLTHNELLENSEKIALASTLVVKSLQEGLGGIRDVLLDGSQEIYCKQYRSADIQLRLAQGSNEFIGRSPRYGMEALGTILIVGLAYVLASGPDGLSRALPVLGALALGVQRILPMLQQAYVAISSIRGGVGSLSDTLALLDQPMPCSGIEVVTHPMPFTKQIELNGLYYRYAPEGPWIINNLSLRIYKGERIGFIGKTGSGKTTLLDLCMGLLQPEKGAIEVDGVPVSQGNRRAWQTHIAHVPQNIFLVDGTIEENIALGVPVNAINRDRVRRVAGQAQLAELIEGWPQQYQTTVGEGGSRLSGGQRQRIGIARALYKQADVLVFDEATSALDEETEQTVMEAIEGLSDELTVLIIAHRVTTLRKCTQVIELRNGQISRVGSYKDVVGNG